MAIRAHAGGGAEHHRGAHQQQRDRLGPARRVVEHVAREHLPAPRRPPCRSSAVPAIADGDAREQADARVGRSLDDRRRALRTSRVAQASVADATVQRRELAAASGSASSSGCAARWKAARSTSLTFTPAASDGRARLRSPMRSHSSRMYGTDCARDVASTSSRSPADSASNAAPRHQQRLRRIRVLGSATSIAPLRTGGWCGSVRQLFSAPSIRCVCSAENTSPYDSGVGLAPSARSMLEENVGRRHADLQAVQVARAR